MSISRTAIAAIVFTGLVIGAGILFTKWTNNPASTTKSSQPSGDVLSSQITLKPFSSPYFSTLIPDSYVAKTNNENAKSPIIGSYLFKDSVISISDQLGITIGKRNGDNVQSISAAKLRESKPDEYVKMTFPNMPAGSIGYQRIDGYEKAILWTKGDRYIVVVLSGTVQRKSQLDQTLQAVLSNWQ